MKKISILVLLVTAIVTGNAQLPAGSDTTNFKSLLIEKSGPFKVANIAIMPTTDTPFVYLPGPKLSFRPNGIFYDIIVVARGKDECALSIDYDGKLVVTDSLQAIQGLLMYIYYNEKRIK